VDTGRYRAARQRNGRAVSFRGGGAKGQMVQVNIMIYALTQEVLSPSAYADGQLSRTCARSP